MGIFAAGNDLVTIILALIPVAVFVLSNLYKVIAKTNPVPPPAPPNGAKPNQPQAGNPKANPRVMDLEAFLRETKKQGSGNQSSRPNPGQQGQGAPVERQKNNSVPTVFAERIKTQQRPPVTPPQKKRANNPVTVLPLPDKGNKKQYQPAPILPQIQGKQSSQLGSLGAMNLNIAPTRSNRTIEENPVGIALSLLRKPHGGAGAFVLQEILGAPRCRNPHRPA